MTKPQLIKTGEAIKLASSYGLNISMPTVISWCRKYQLGRQLGGKFSPWVVEKQKFEEFINGKKKPASYKSS